MKCKKCLYRANCQFLAKHKCAEVEGCTAFKDAADFVEVVRCEKCVHKVDYKGRVMCGRRAIKYDGGWAGLKATDNDHFCSYVKRKDGAE
jgi:hypothetical protein